MENQPEPTDTATTKRTRKRKRAKVTDAYFFMAWIPRQVFTTDQSVEQRLHHEMVEFVQFIMPTPQERVARQRVFAAIATLLRRGFPQGEARLFGSVSHNLCLPDGDLDICFETQTQTPAQVENSLCQFAGLLKTAGISDDVLVNRWARVPVMSLTTKHELGKIKVDIGINNVDGLLALEIINDYLTAMPALRPLVMVIKAFLAQKDLNSSAKSGLNSYALICMVISFLQLNPTDLPVDFINQPFQTQSLGVLLLHFFGYYGNTFPYDTSYISVTQGKLLPKSSARWITDPLSDRLSIQCLVLNDNDIAKATAKIEAVKQAFREANTALASGSISNNTQLGRIIGISPLILEYRKHMQRIVDTGRLDRALRRSTSHPGPKNQHKGQPQGASRDKRRRVEQS